MPKLTLEQFKKWGRQGGKRRAANLTPEQRSEASRKAGQAKARKAAR